MSLRDRRDTKLLALFELVGSCATMIEAQARVIEVLVEQAEQTPRLRNALAYHAAMHDQAERNADTATRRL